MAGELPLRGRGGSASTTGATPGPTFTDVFTATEDQVSTTPLVNRSAPQPGERLAALVEERVAPALFEHGFAPTTGALVADRGEVAWVVDIELAPWSRPGALSVALAWGVHVPGVDDVLTETVWSNQGEVAALAPWACPVNGRAGDGSGDLAGSWHSVRSHWWPLDHVTPVLDLLDARTAAALVSDAVDDVLPRLATLTTLAEVQAHLACDLDRNQGADPAADLTIARWIFALSVLRGERDNARRWLDYLASCSARTTPPDVVAERLAPLRQRCLA